MKKFTLNLKYLVFSAGFLCLVFCSGFKRVEDPAIFIQQFLQKYYDSESDVKPLKRLDINVTNNGFCRYRRVLSNGKEEYFAFNLTRFKSIDFYGNTKKGDLYIRTKNDDVIVQTRNDRKGEVDSTSTYLVIPIKGVEVEQLNLLVECFEKGSQVLNANK